MSRRKKPEVVKYTPETEKPFDARKPLCWESFFQCQRSPILRSEMLTVLMAGTPLEAERVPTPSLLDAVLIAMAAREYYDAEIVDDFAALCSRTEELWSKPDWTERVFSSVHSGTANFVLKGSREFTCAEDLYISAMVGWYMRHDPPQYFSKELTEKDFPDLFIRRKDDAAFAARLMKNSGSGPASLIKALKVSDVAVAKNVVKKSSLKVRAKKRIVAAPPVKRKNPPSTRERTADHQG